MSIYKFFDKKISGPFTIPSGIVTTQTSTLQLIAQKIPQIGILTTKSIGPQPRLGNREPIIAQFDHHSWVNAVGLTNPGADNFAKQLQQLRLADHKFLLCSIFGSDQKDFSYVAKKLAPFVDGFEINASCPHAKGYGRSIGTDPDIVFKITKAVASFNLPTLIKLSADMPLETIVKAALAGGIDGFVCSNTLGPGLFLHDGQPILTNKLGGVSGKAILPIVIRSIKQIRALTSKPIIGCGGISSAQDIKNYQQAGANFFGIGSALAGMSTNEIKKYFNLLEKDINNQTNLASHKLKTKLFCNYKPFKITKKTILNKDLFTLQLNGQFNILPGQFVFLWIPGHGEKPFSLFDNRPPLLFIKKRGLFTKKLSKLSPGDKVYLRGPYGHGSRLSNKRLLLIGGGTGICSLYPFTKTNPKSTVLLGGKNKSSLPFLNKFKKTSQKLLIATESGQIGQKGFVTDLLKKVLKNNKFDYCFNCGPLPMVEKAVKIEKEYLSKNHIFSSLDLLTKCGVGLCGSCATAQGYRSCVDGPFMKLSQNCKSIRIDPHVHCRDGLQSYKETIAHVFQIADSQGVQKFFDMPNTNPPILSEADVKNRLILVPKNRLKDYYLYIGATSNPDQLKQEVNCWHKYRQVIGIKMFAGHSVGSLAIVSPRKQKLVYQTLTALDYRGVLAVHCEKEELLNINLFNPQKPTTHSLSRPKIAEIQSIKEQIQIASLVKFKGILHICHVSTPRSVNLIDRAKKHLRLTCGITPHHLLWDHSRQKTSNGLLYKMNPPLRSPSVVKKLRVMLLEGKIDWIETDHAPHQISEKLYPPYMSGFPSLILYRDLVKNKLPSWGFTPSQINKLTYLNIMEAFNEQNKLS